MDRKSVKLGLMPPLTGLVGIYGTEIARAGQMACAEVNEAGGVLGKPLELIIEDDRSLPESAVAAATKLVDEHECSAIIGNLLSNSRIAVAYRIAEPKKIPYLNFSFYEGSILSRYFFHFAALPNQQINRMIPYMAEKFGRSMFFAGNNYEWPRGSIDAAKKILLRHGGKILGEEYTEIGVPIEEIDLLLDRVEEAAPDVFVPYFAGSDQVNLLTRFTERGMKSKMAVVMGHYDEMMASKLSPEIREGFFSSNTYFMTVDTPANRTFLERLSKWPGVTGIWPDGNGILTNFGEGAYVCVKAFAKAANRAGTLDSEALVDSLNTLQVSAPQGELRMDSSTHHARVNTYLSRCSASGKFEIIEKFGSIDPVLPDRYSHQRISHQATMEDDIRLQARMLEQMNEGIMLVDSRDGGILYANAGAERLFGYDHGDLIAKNWKELSVPVSLEPVLYDLMRKGKWSGELEKIQKSGKRIWCASSFTTFTHPVHGEVWLVVYNDITERKLAEAELSAMTLWKEAILDSVDVAIISTDPDAVIKTFSRGAELMLGYKSEELVGKETPLIFYEPKELEEKAEILSNKLNKKIKPGIEMFLIGAGDENVAESEWTYIRKDGSRLSVMLNFNYLMDSKKNITGFVGVVRDISEQKRIDRMKNEFISTVSHELRTPLTSIAGSLGLILSGTLGKLPEKVKDMIFIANNNSKRLSYLINDLLDLEKIASGKMQFDIHLQKLQPLLEQSVTNNQSYGSECGVSLILKNIDEKINVITDGQRLMQVLANLISNAIKFSPEGETVVLHTEMNGAYVRINVTDKGPGIPAEFRNRIFQKFSQADSSDARKKGGTGLGLFISRDLIERMGGKIGFSSVTGKGSCFYVDLPLQKDNSLSQG